jgi:hypothetical protein
MPSLPHGPDAPRPNRIHEIAATRGHGRDGVQSGREWDDMEAVNQLIVMKRNNRDIDTNFPE